MDHTPSHSAPCEGRIKVGKVEVAWVKGQEEDTRGGGKMLQREKSLGREGEKTWQVRRDASVGRDSR